LTDPVPLDALDRLVLECLQRLEDEGPGALDALCGEHPDQADALRSRVAALGGAGLLEAPGDPPERLGEFRLAHRLGGGSMGVVYAAVQESLGRQVALKLVRPDQLLFPESRARFQREVEVVASLGHPAIIPVYTVGEEQGVPFFAMELQQGATLAELLSELGAPPRTGAELAEALARLVERRDGERPAVSGELFEGDGVDACLRIARAVADALEHAHRRGVLHRDVKPSNIMITTDGRALLFDFGLAQSRDAVRVTTSGSRVGSLAYMAPETVAGEDVDAATDVYGLGAALCEALTGEPPHAEVRGEALAHAILIGDPVPLRARRRGLSRDLETVCHKALERDPSRRYASAEALSRDLGHLLARRPVEARRTGPLTRVTLWARRHPARAAALVLVIALPSSLAWQRGVAAERLRAQRDLAEQNLDRALDALQIFLLEVGRDTLQHVPHMEAARLALIEQALVFLEEVMPQRPDDPELLLRWARVQRSRAEVLDQLGRTGEAVAAVREQLSVLTARQAVGNLEHAQAVNLIGAHNLLGNLLERQGLLDEALAAWREAEALLDTQDAGELGLARAIVQRNLARLLAGVGSVEEALAASTDAVAEAETLLHTTPDTDRERVAEAELLLGATLASQAALLAQVQRHGEVGPWVRRALQPLLRLAQTLPERPDVAYEAAMATVIALDHLPDGEAREALDRGLALAETLVADYPDTPNYGRALCACLMSRALLSVRAGDPRAALAPLVRADAHAAELLAHAPDDFDVLFIQGMAGLNLATLLVQLERRDEACAPAERSSAAFERALAQRPARSDLLPNLAWSLVQGGYGLAARGEWEQAVGRVERVPGLLPDDAILHVARAEVLAASIPSAPSARVDELAEAALDALARGRALGFEQLDYLRTCAELASVRSLPRFDQLLSTP
jgi:serine/threonine protein kinase/tetratricopeptide (TPR) repeat protein